MRRGLYRIHGMDARPDDVRVEDDGIDVPLEEGLRSAYGSERDAPKAAARRLRRDDEVAEVSRRPFGARGVVLG